MPSGRLEKTLKSFWCSSFLLGSTAQIHHPIFTNERCPRWRFFKVGLRFV